MTREEYIKKFIERIKPKLQEKIQKEKLGLFIVDTEPVMVLGQVIAEIETSMTYMNLIPLLITSHSTHYEKKGFSRVQQHRKNIESYLAEVYILKERVVRLLTLLKKNLIKNGMSKTNKEILLIDSLKKKFIVCLTNILDLRGEHTHEYSYQDNELHHLELLDLGYHELDFTQIEKKHLISDLTFALRMNRKSWKEKIQKNTKALSDQLDTIYSKVGILIEKI